MFVRPGKHQYVIKAPSGEMVQYSFISGIRNEDVPEKLLFNEVTVKKIVEKKFVRETSIFADFKVDNDTVLSQCFQYDKKYWKIARLTKDVEDLRKTESIIKANYSFLKQFFLTSAASSKFPFVTMIDFSRVV